MPDIEVPQQADNKEEKRVGIFIAILAVVMAVVSAFGSDAANNMIVNEVKASNGFAWYQAKRQRGHVNEVELARIQMELLGNPTDSQRAALEKLQAELQAKNAEYEVENRQILTESKGYQLEARVAGERNEALDRAEILLQVAVVLCTLTLLTGMAAFLRLGIVVAIAGLVFGALAFRPRSEPPEASHAPAASPSTPGR